MCLGKKQCNGGESWCFLLMSGEHRDVQMCTERNYCNKENL